MSPSPANPSAAPSADPPGKRSADTSRQPPAALVTGASSGIGKAIAAALLQQGFSVYGTSRQPQAQPQSVIQWLYLDAACPTSLERFIGEHAEQISRLDLLVNNAGTCPFGDFCNISPALHQAAMQLLLHSPMRMAQVVLPAMRARGQGSMVFVTSLAGAFPLPYMAAYSAAKAGLSAFAASLMLTEKNSGVNIIDLQPGDLRTGFNRAVQRVAGGSGEQRVWERMEALLESAPGAELAASDLLAALRSGDSGVLRSGGWLQTRAAPVGQRLMPQRWIRRLLRRYYRLSEGGNT